MIKVLVGLSKVSACGERHDPTAGMTDTAGIERITLTGTYRNRHASVTVSEPVIAPTPPDKAHHGYRIGVGLIIVLCRQIAVC